MAATVSSSLVPLHHHYSRRQNQRTATAALRRTLHVGPTTSASFPAFSMSVSRKRWAPAMAAAAVAEKIDVEEASKRLYVGNIPRTVTNEELEKIFAEHGAVQNVQVMYDKYSGKSRRFAFVTMSTAEDATAAIEKMNDTEIGGRKIKVNITEKPLPKEDPTVPKVDDSLFVESSYKAYVGNIVKTVTSEELKKFFSEKVEVLGAKITHVPGTSKSGNFGFVTFSSEEHLETAITSFNNAVLEGQKIRVNKA